MIEMIGSRFFLLTVLEYNTKYAIRYANSWKKIELNDTQ